MQTIEDKIMFYEQNNIAAFKKIFIEQYEFAVLYYGFGCKWMKIS